jgi:hypothetical protein
MRQHTRITFLCHAGITFARIGRTLCWLERPTLEAVGVQFDKIANYEAEWKIEGPWAFQK